MRIFAIAGLVIALAAASVPIHAQQPDHHTESFRARFKA